MISTIKGIITLLEAIPALRVLMVDFIRILKQYEADKRKQDKLDMAYDAIDRVEQQLRNSQRKRKETNRER